MMRASFLLLILGHAGAQNLNPNPNNGQFDPDVTETGWCTLPPYQDLENYHTPELGMCTEPDPALTIENARTLAVEYAPYLYFHPLEKYTLTDIDLAFEDPDAGKIYFKKFSDVFDEQLNQTAMLTSTRDPLLGLNGFSYFYSHNFEGTELYTHDFFNPPGYLKGSGYDEQGRTNAPIYYNVYDSGNNTWTFNYFFYYAFNGHANMGALSSYNGTERYTPFMLRPIGQHEGDWEAMSVQVCQSTTPSQPLAVSYRQHGWNEITSCLEGKCNFFKNTNHPVGFSALNSHATYTQPTRNLLYTNVEIPFFVNLQGVLVLDRTEFRDADGSYKQFLPNESNVIPLIDPADIELGVTPEGNYWQAWAGSFGDITKPKINTSDPNCLAQDQHSFVECPTEEEDPVFTLVMQFLGVYEVNGTNAALIQQAAGAVSGVVNSLFTNSGGAPEGPQRKNYYKKWVAPIQSPLWSSIPANTTEEEYCKRLIEIPDTSLTTISVYSPDLISAIIGILAVSVVLPLIAVIWYLWPRFRGKAFEPVIDFDDVDGNVVKPSRAAWWKVHRPALMFTLAFALGIAGLAIFANGNNALFDLLEDLLGGEETWDFITSLILILGIIVCVIDCCLLIAMWIPTIALWKHVWIAYYEAIDDEENAEKTKKSYFAKSFGTKHVIYVVFFSFLYLSLTLTTLVVIVAAGIVGFSWSFTQACNATLGSMDGVCLDLSFLGIDDIGCGSDFQEFCSEWGAAARVRTLWGAFVLMWAHFAYVATAGESYYCQVSVYPQVLSLKKDQELRKSLLASTSVARQSEAPPDQATAVDTAVEQVRQESMIA